MHSSAAVDCTAAEAAFNVAATSVGTRCRNNIVLSYASTMILYTGTLIVFAQSVRLARFSIAGRRRIYNNNKIHND